MQEIEYFCLLTVDRKVKGSVVQKLEEELVDADRSITTAQDVYYAACKQVTDRLTRYGANDPADITIRDFRFWPNELNIPKFGDA